MSKLQSHFLDYTSLHSNIYDQLLFTLAWHTLDLALREKAALTAIYSDLAMIFKNYQLLQRRLLPTPFFFPSLLLLFVYMQYILVNPGLNVSISESASDYSTWIGNIIVCNFITVCGKSVLHVLSGTKTMLHIMQK